MRTGESSRGRWGTASSVAIGALLLLVSAVGAAMTQEAPPPEEASASAEPTVEEQLNAVFSRVGALSEIRAEVSDGVVVLSGEVASSGAAEDAVTLARGMPGVLYVDDRIRENVQVGERVGPTLEKLRVLGARLADLLPLLLLALVVVGAFWLLARAAQAWEAPYRRLVRSPLARNMLRQVVFFAVFLAGVLIALELLDATTLVGAVLGTAGVAGIALGFAFRDIVENYLASLLLSIWRPFSPDDHVVVDGREGKVVRMTSRETVLMTLEGNHLRLPNALVFKGVILNYTRNPLRRLDFTAGVGEREDLARAQKVGLEALRAVPGVLEEPTAFARVQALADSNVTVRFFAWVDQRQVDHGKVRSEAIRRVKVALDEAGVDLPVPIQQVRLEEKQGQQEPPPRKRRKGAAEEESAHEVEVDDALERQIAEDRRSSDEKDLLGGDESRSGS